MSKAETKGLSGRSEQFLNRVGSADRKGVAILAVSVVLAAACAAGLYQYLKGVAPVQAAEAPKTVPVVVASQDVTFGTVLDNAHLKIVEYPEAAVPKGAFGTMDSVLAQSTRVFLMEGEPVLASKLSSVGGGLSLRIPESQRAITLSVNEVTGVNGFILPGDRVDVLVTIDNVKGPGVAVTKTILQNVEVLASGSKTETRRNQQITVQSITLVVEPKGAESLALALHQGEVHVMLRNPVDHEVYAAKSTDTKEVLDLYTKTTTSTKRSTTVTTPTPQDPSYTIIRNGAITKQESPEGR
jgi:pilus assembly protein CpaB